MHPAVHKALKTAATVVLVVFVLAILFAMITSCVSQTVNIDSDAPVCAEGKVNLAVTCGTEDKDET